MRYFTVVILWLALLAAPATVVAQDRSGTAQRTERIEAQLVPMSAWVAPGSTAVVAIRQKIQPGWHTYWRNPGDSGGPPTLAWTLPQGVVAGDIVWPLPTRQRLQTLLNYGFEDVVFLPVPIEVPATARPGTDLRLAVKVLFLVCSAEMCVPDQMTLTLDLPVRDGAAPLARPYGPAIQSVIETAPRPAGITAHVGLEGQTLTLSATGGPLAGQDLSRASFFPYEGTVITHAAPQFGRRGPAGVTLTLAASADLVAGELTGPISGVLATDGGAWEITATPGPPLAGASGDGSTRDTEDVEPVHGGGFDAGTALQAVLFALLGGLILNLMPCVFPVLAMKAASLIGAPSGHDPAQARRDGVAFTAGVLTTFLALGAGLLALRAGGQAIGWGFQLQSPTVIAGLALLMLAVALNLSGVFQVGGRLQGLGGSRLARLSGGAGAFFTGVLAVVVAAPCTAPFMAFALGAALVLPVPVAMAVFLMLGLGLALPYLLISVSPGLLRRLPRPGPWMEGLRGLLAFPMYGTALWLVWVFGRQRGGEALALMLASGLMLALTLWLIGRAQSLKAEGRPVRLHLVGVVVAAVAALVLTGTAIGSPREPRVAQTGSSLPSQPWSAQAVSEALAQGRPVLVDFTADWCVSCKINERTALSSPVVARAIARANAVYLKADWTERDDAITRELIRHGRSGVPLYLLYSPGRAEPRILPQLLTEGVVVEALK